jgi:hypothetical protein
MGPEADAFNLALATSGVAARQLTRLEVRGDDGILIIAANLGMLLPYLS